MCLAQRLGILVLFRKDTGSFWISLDGVKTSRPRVLKAGENLTICFAPLDQPVELSFVP